jgi:ABC-type sugar transport system permease subunit
MEGATNLQPHLETLVWSAFTVLFIGGGSFLLAKLASWISRRLGVSASESRKVYWGFLFAGPWILGFVIFVVGPALASFYYSFTDYKLGDPIEWIGLENYRQLLLGGGSHGRRFAEAMYNSFYYAIVGIPLQVGTALLMAILLNQQLRGIKFFRLIFYLPVILAGGPAVLLAWRYMFASNGGFVNVTLQGLAQNFFLFDWLYRFFIFFVEGFNGFYAGIARGDPIGPLKYTLPALIGAVALWTLLRGEWSDARRSRAMSIAEIIGGGLAVILFARGLISDPIEPALIYAGGLVALIGTINASLHGRPKSARLWQFGGLLLFAVGLAVVLISGSAEQQAAYLPVILIAAAPLAVSLIGTWGRPKFILTGVLAALLFVLILTRLVPGQLDNGQMAALAQQVTLNTSLAQPENAEYLESYEQVTPSPLWIYGAVVAVLGVLALANNRYPRAQRYFIYGAFVVFALLAVGSLLDGIRYFRAFDEIAQATGERNYHFALFRDVTRMWPDSNRVPLWLNSELWSKPSLVLITAWSSGAGMLIFLAALKGVPQVFYESAEVDGANRWQKFVKITLPMISPALFYNIVIGVIAALQTFESVYIIQTPLTVDSITSAAFFLFNRTFRQLFIGQGAAASWILAVIIVLLTALQFRYSRWVHYEA